MEENRLFELLTRKKANEASAEELIELDELLKSFPEALQLQDAFNEIWYSKVEDEDVSMAFERHQQRFEREFDFDEESGSFFKSIQTFKRSRYLFAAVAIFVIISLGTAIFFATFSLKKSNESALTQIITGRGIHKFITLPDGTKVWLNTDSKLSYNPAMKNSEYRMVSLTGEAFFDIAHNTKHPFILKSNKVSIVVTGTAFNVKDYQGDTRCETTLLRGSIELSLNQDPLRKFKLAPSEKLAVIEGELVESPEQKTSKQVKAGGTFLSLEKVESIKLDDKELSSETSWLDNKMVFKNEAFKTLVPEFERWFDAKIIIKSKHVEDFKFTGVFTNETIEQALQAMQIIKPFNYKIYGKEVVIYQ